MSATLQSPLTFGCAALALALAGSPAAAADPVRASFERMLAHEPTAVAVQAAPFGPADPLIGSLVVPLRDHVWPTPMAVASGPLAESFARMLNHEPNWAPPPPPAGAGTDPLIATVVWPLLRTNQYLIASVASQPPR